jgi:hypothetical protein
MTCQGNKFKQLISEYSRVLIEFILKSPSENRSEMLVSSGMVPSFFKDGLFYKESGFLGRDNSFDRTLLKKHAHLSMARSVLIESELIKICVSLNSIGIIPILLKGSDLGIWLYRDFFLREMDDIDLLVKPEDLDAVCRLMQKNGYRVLKGFNGAHITFIAEVNGAIPIEVHTALYRKDVFLHNLVFKDRIKSGCLDRTSQISFKGAQIRLLEKSDRLEYLCFHFIKHGVKSGKWALDLLLLFHIYYHSFAYDETYYDKSEYSDCKVKLKKSKHDSQKEIKLTALQRMTLEILNDFFRDPQRAYRLRIFQKMSESAPGRGFLFMFFRVVIWTTGLFKIKKKIKN